MLSPVRLVLLASTVSAYPWVADAMEGRHLNERSLSGFWDTITLGVKDISQSLGGVLKAQNEGKMKALGAEIKKGVDVIYAQAAACEGFEGWPKPSLLNTTADALSKELIYETYNLDRSAPPIWPIADEGHPYVAPGPGDIRGPCPGLNTLANHGYLPHNGIVSPDQLVLAVWEGLSMSPDLAAILTVAGFVFKGDTNTMKLSIGGKVNGAGVGLSQHGTIEGDGSVTRFDSNMGDHVKVSQERLQIYYGEIAKYGTNGYDINPTVCAESRYRAYQDSVQNNPAVDFSSTRHLVAYAESGFAMEVFRGANVSCTAETIDWFFSKEQFPPGWRRRNTPVTATEMIAWGMLFNKIKPTEPVRGLGIKGRPVKAGSSFLSEGTVKSNIEKFSGGLSKAVPKAMKYMAEALGQSGPLAGLDG